MQQRKRTKISTGRNEHPIDLSRIYNLALLWKIWTIEFSPSRRLCDFCLVIPKTMPQTPGINNPAMLRRDSKGKKGMVDSYVFLDITYAAEKYMLYNWSPPKILIILYYAQWLRNLEVVNIRRLHSITNYMNYLEI